MANTKSAKKMIRAAERRRINNKPVRSAMRTQITKARAAIDEGGETMVEAIRLAISALDTAAKRGVIHRNAASRRKSRLMKRANAVAAAPAPAGKPARPTKAAAGKTAASKTAAKPRTRSTAKPK